MLNDFSKKNPSQMHCKQMPRILEKITFEVEQRLFQMVWYKSRFVIVQFSDN